MKTFLFFITLTFFCLIASLSLAHRVNIFCFVEDKNILCEANYPSGEPVKKGIINLKTANSEKIIASKPTDTKGKAIFTLKPEILQLKKDLEAEVLAGMGHKNTWMIPYQELNPELKSSVATSSAKLPWEEKKKITKPNNFSRQELEETLNKLLDRKLRPVLEKLTLLQEKRISIQDIIAGLGYILGLMGISFYFLAKKNDK